MMIQNKNYQIFLNFNQMRLFKFFLRREKNQKLLNLIYSKHWQGAGGRIMKLNSYKK